MYSSKVIAFTLFLLTAVQLAAADIVCTTYPVWLLARDIAGNDSSVPVKLLVKQSGTCAHEYTPNANDLKLLTHPNTILICSGMDLDAHLVKSARRVNRKLRIIRASHPQDTFDEHNFAAPDTALRMAECIAAGLSRLLPEKAELFKQNSCKFTTAMQQIIDESPLPRAGTTVILQSNIFKNFARFAKLSADMLHLERSSAISPAKLQKLLQQNRQQKFQAILQEENLPDPAAEKLSHTGKIPAIKLNMLLSGPDDPPEHYFIKIMRCNLVKLQKGLAQ